MKKKFLQQLSEAKNNDEFGELIESLPDCKAKGHLEAKLYELLSTQWDIELIREELQYEANANIWK